ncbi:metallophosphoesterase [Azospirillum rugosum]|uniref:metallophosphoesterase n=1 Tax=Azospirillum rugosum TaxID=416170 RepID=UPI00360D9F71
MATFFTSDTHFGHANILKHCQRPFANIDEHDEELVRRWNEVVGPDDDVHHLGDFAYRCDPKRLASIFKRLNGRKHLTIGNHEKGPTLQMKWASEPVPYREITVDGQRIVLFHFGMRVWNAMRYGTLHFYGHSHGKLSGNRQSLDVGVDCWNFRPVSLEQIRGRLAEFPEFRHQGSDEE